MNILLFGASGSGTTTLGKEIAKRSDFQHLDADDYYWKQTNPPFQEKVQLTERNENLKADIKRFKDVIVSGSLVSWGKEWHTAFDLAIFIRLDHAVRMERLKQRETERYGVALLSNKKLHEQSKAFLDWASQYDNPKFNGRSIKVHENWIELLDCEVLTLDGQKELAAKAEIVLEKIKAI